MIEVGKRAPSFTLPDQDGNQLRLADLRGRWLVLYFYPKDDTPGCTVEACEFTDSIKDFESLDATVLGCSPDSPESHRRFIAKHDLSLTLVSDESKAMMQEYGAWGEKMLYGRKLTGVIRSTVLIDSDGKVAHHWKRANAKGHAASVQKRLAALRG